MTKTWLDYNTIDSALKEVVRLADELLRQPGLLNVTGIKEGGRGFLISRLEQRFSPILVITSNQDVADTLYEDLLFFLQPDRAQGCALFPSNGVLYSDILPWRLYGQRLKTLRGLAEGHGSLAITPIQALLEKVIPQKTLLASMTRIEVGQERERERLVRRIISLGYTRVEMVEEKGEMSIRGGILDIYPLDQECPLRIEFFGDHAESIRTFDVETQRSLQRIREAVITPVQVTGNGDLFDYLPPRTLTVLLDPPEIEREADEFWESVLRQGKESDYLAPQTVIGVLRERPRVEIGGWEVTSGHEPAGQRVAIRASSNSDLTREIKTAGLKALADRVRAWVQEKWAVYIVAQTEVQAKRIAELFEEWGIRIVFCERFPEDPHVNRGFVGIVVGTLKAGFCLPSELVSVVTEEEIFGQKRRVGHGRRARPTTLSNFEDLASGNYVVHLDYGIGIYRGLVRLEGEGVENDYLLLEYDGGDKLYLPVDRLNLVSKYIGVGEKLPKIDKLGGRAWTRTKKKVKRAAEKVAKALLEIYAARKAFPGYAFSPRDAYFKAFEAAFEYEETPDQLDAIDTVMEDMEEAKAMDRLVCGDVGYGKTEVAIRAAFKAVLDGKQVVFVVPTTVLAQQHYLTFISRFRDYPVLIDFLSRFKSPAQQRAVLRQLKEGKIDIVIGTHRVLQDDVVFHALGLVIIDEEHRFGVAHKEKLKEMRKLVDCLTLTATPIPRTLQMSLLGIRDLSVMATPPPNRQAIATYIVRFDRRIIAEAILKEMSRGGQIFFVHNRVKDIRAVAGMLRELVPEIRLAVAHGQMKERTLETVMLQFVGREIDLLLCTSIIESGLDIANANTIIINHAERFGLAELYQLRGRVGRSAEKAYAYLVVPPREQLSREAFKRLRALQELSELGSGFRLAMRDLEIRGAGNLLGHVQAGQVNQVGFELYNSLLEKAIKELKGEEVKEQITPEIRLPVEAFIPDNYVADDTQRLMLYKRLSILGEEKEIEDVALELQDRFGPVPQQVLNLLEVIRLKTWLKACSVQRFEFKDNRAVLTFSEEDGVSPEKLVTLIKKANGRYRLTPDMQLAFSPETHDWKGVVEETRSILGELV